MRYLILVLLNTPIIFLALINIITQYKLKKVSVTRLRHQLIIWLIILVVLIGSFPLYNIICGRAALDSHELSSFDIIQTSAIVFLFYTFNSLRQRLDQTELRLRNLHQELSIRLSQDESKKH